jgi:hypothetical protein
MNVARSAIAAPAAGARRVADGESFIPAELDDPAAPRFDRVTREVGELLRQQRRGGISTFPREGGVPADVRDDERQKVRLLTLDPLAPVLSEGGLA